MSSIPPFPVLQRGKLITDGLIGCWRMYEGSGLIAHDISGNGNHGDLEGGASWSLGREGHCIDLNGTTGAVRCGSIDKSKSLSQLSLCFWNFRTASTDHFFVGAFQDGNTRYEIIQYLTTIYADVSNGSSAYGSAGNTRTGVHHYAFVFNGLLSGNARFALYIDNVFIPMSVTGSPPATTPSVDIPFDFGERSNFWTDGKLDDIRVYNRALAQQEITQIAGGHG